MGPVLWPRVQFSLSRTTVKLSNDWVFMIPATDHWSNLIPETQNSSFKSCFCKLGGCLLRFMGGGDNKTPKKGGGIGKAKIGKRNRKEVRIETRKMRSVLIFFFLKQINE